MRNLNPVSWMSKLFDNKKFLVAFSIICAIVFWLIIDITENPSRDITFSEIPVSLSEQKDDDENVLIPIGDNTKSVKVTVNGPGYIVSTVSKDDITVSVKSYSEVSEPGTYVLTLSATVDKNDCKVVSISPSFVQVVYDYNVTKDIPIEIDASEYLDADCEIEATKSKFYGSTSEITALTVTGPSEFVSPIEKVVIKPDLPAQTILTGKQSIKDFNLVFYDALGNQVDSSMLEYDVADHSLRIVVLKRAFVEVVPNFINVPAYYTQPDKSDFFELFRNDELTKSSQKITVEVKGLDEKVDYLIQNGLKLEAIDFKDIKGEDDCTFLRSFVLDEGVEIIDGTERIVVKLNLGTLSTSKEISVDPAAIKLVNTGDKDIEVNYNGTIKVTLCGASADIKKIKAGNLVLTIDCAGGTISEGKIVVSADAKYRAWAIKINVETVTLTMK